MSWRGRLANAFHELYFLVGSDKKSAVARTWYEKNYKELKLLNPSTPIAIRVRDPMDYPVMVARYGESVNTHIYIFLSYLYSPR